MVWLDWLILIILALSVFSGAKSGAVARIIQIIAVIISASECWRIAPWLRDNVVCYLEVNHNFAKIIALVLAFGVLYLAIWGVGSWLTSFIKGGLSGAINMLLGAILGLVIAIYALGYAFTFIDSVGPTTKTLARYELSDPRLSSKFYLPIKESVVDLEGLKTYLTLEDKAAAN